MNVQITPVDDNQVEVVIENSEGTTKLLVMGYNGLEIVVADMSAEDLRLVSVDGDVELLTGALKGDICMLIEGEVYIMPTDLHEYRGYHNRFLSRHTEGKGHVYKLGSSTLVIKKEFRNNVSVGINVYLE